MPAVTTRTFSSAVGAALAALALLAVLASPVSPAVSDASASGDGLLSLKDLLGDPSFNDVLSRSFEAILSDSQLVCYEAEDEVGRFLYRKRFWTRCDPTPATDANEFLEEHLRRLAYTLANFCPAGDMDWDARGDVALRFGIPSYRARGGGSISSVYGGMGLDPPSEEWGYTDKEMTVSFIDPNLDQRYQTGFDIRHATAHGRAETYPKVRDPSAGPPDPPEVPVYVAGAHEATKQKALADRGQSALDEVPLSYGYASVDKPLPLYYEIVAARGTDGRTDVAINYQVPRSELAYEPGGEYDTAGLDKRLRVMNEDYDVLTSQARSLTVLTPRGADIAEDDLLTDEWRFDLEPGIYIVGFAVEDTTTKRVGFGRSLVKVPDYRTPAFSMSDIQLATGVGPGQRFIRMGGAVAPNPIHAFRQSEEMVIYFELYGLTEDLPGIGRFTVTTEITAGQFRPEEGWLRRFMSRLIPERPLSISTRVIGTGPVPDTAYWFSLALASLEQDNYDLMITVKDVRAGTEVSRTTPFTVLED